MRNHTKQIKPENPTSPFAIRTWSASRLSVLICKLEQNIHAHEKTFLTKLYQYSPCIKEAANLAIQFSQILREKKSDEFDNWINKVKSSGVTQLKNFVSGLCRDYEAVKQAATMEWSNGQVEGQINRLKSIKRQMYGRGGFELLKKRVLLNSC